MTIDINGFLGPWPYWNGPHRREDETLKLMDRHSIDLLSVCHTRSIFGDWRAGNESVIQIASTQKRFIPFVSVSPIMPAPEVARSLEQYRKRGIKGIRLYPQHHRYSLTENAEASRMLDTIQALGFPVMLPVRVIIHWGLPVMDLQSVNTVVKRYTKVPFIVSGTNYGESLWLFDLMKRHENVSVEISGMQAFRAVSEAVATVGDRRILFGSGMPILYPACSTVKLKVSKLSEKQHAAISSGNARRLLGI